MPLEEVMLWREYEEAYMHSILPTLFPFPKSAFYKINTMQIVILSRTMFELYMKQKNITPDNVEQLKDVFIISIQNDLGDDTDKAYTPTFTESKENVHVVKFSDVDHDTEYATIGGTMIAKAMTAEQAKKMYQFIMDNKANGKTVCLVHCTAGIARSGAVGAFVAECFGVNYLDFKRANPNVLPNVHVLKTLREARFPGSMPDFEMERLNPRTPQQEAALFNDRHPDQYMTCEEVKWVDFWLETNQYFSIIRKGDLPVLREVYPDMTELLAKARLYEGTNNFDDLPTFGIRHDYKGITLGRWLAERNMLQFFNN